MVQFWKLNGKGTFGSARSRQHLTSRWCFRIINVATQASAQDKWPQFMRENIDLWLELDDDEERCNTIRAMCEEGSSDLQKWFGSNERLSFGTAGLRALDGPGFYSMNTVTVKQTTQGLVRYLQQQEASGWDLRCGDDSPNMAGDENFLGENGIVVGYDGRTNSKRYAEAVADTAASQNIRVHLFPAVVATPLLAHAVQHLRCAAGVMVTASHNPAPYNGYKVYYCNGCQIIPPHDAGIAGLIEENLRLWPPASPEQRRDLIGDVGESVAETYFQYLKEQLCYHSEANSEAERCVYTPLHGVGLPFVQRAFQCMNLPPPIVVPAQAQPDSAFPTTPFPNPEEGAGVWKLAHAEGEANGVRLALANDPDADRLAAAEWQPPSDGHAGAWYAFSGNEIGILLASWLWEEEFKGAEGEVVMLTTVVSSRMLAAMGLKEGFRVLETLTGFKWLGNWSMRQSLEGKRVPFAYEEAIGFAVGEQLRDKDGITAAAVFAEMAAACYRQGGSLLGRLKGLQEKYGHFAFIGGYVTSDDQGTMARIFDDIRGTSENLAYPVELGGLEVVSIRDLGTGLDTSQPDQRATLPWKSGDLFISFELEGNGVATLRASGTEPKLKYYLEVKGTSMQKAQDAVSALEQDVVQNLLKPEHYGLSKPS